MRPSLADRYWLLVKVNELACTIATAADIFRQVCRVAQDSVPYECAILSLYDLGRNSLRIAETFDIHESGTDRIRHLLDRGNTHIGWVQEHGTSLLCRDLERACRFPDDKKMVDVGYRCACSVPMIVRDRSLGVLSMLASQKNRLSANHIGLLEEISKPIALAIGSLGATGPMHSNGITVCRQSVVMGKRQAIALGR
jgi:GAF domain-containing protein